MASEFVRLIEPAGMKEKEFQKLIEYLTSALTPSSIRVILFVFDNFETVGNPETYSLWMDTTFGSPEDFDHHSLSRDSRPTTLSRSLE